MRDSGLTILILGNGFDLAHGLPTRYSDFLEFCQRVEAIWTYKIGIDYKRIRAGFHDSWIKNWEIDKTIKEAIWKQFICRITGHTAEQRIRLWNLSGFKASEDDIRELVEIHRLLSDNIWYHYFVKLYRNELVKGVNWIDFESEIRFIIQEVDRNSSSLTDSLNGAIRKLIRPHVDSWERMRQSIIASLNNKFTFNDKLKLFYKVVWRFWYETGRAKTSTFTVKDFRENAYKDLERFTRALEIYLATFVEKISINKKISEIANLHPDYVINFNYTDTYQRVYGNGSVYHIHGKADTEHSIEENNMVLGIDEYWVGAERDERTNFTIFKKFSQRIQKHTGNGSYKYLKEVQDVFEAKGKQWSGNADTSEVHPDGVSYVYVFGHSLDVTDKDILSSFIGSDATSVTVYCKDRGTEGELIANTIKLIGEEKLLDKANHVPVKLKYVIQKKKLKQRKNTPSI